MVLAHADSAGLGLSLPALAHLQLRLPAENAPTRRGRYQALYMSRRSVIADGDINACEVDGIRSAYRAQFCCQCPVWVLVYSKKVSNFYIVIVSIIMDDRPVKSIVLTTISYSSSRIMLHCASLCSNLTKPSLLSAGYLCGNRVSVSLHTVPLVLQS